jgi:hypothetical protein
MPPGAGDRTCPGHSCVLNRCTHVARHTHQAQKLLSQQHSSAGKEGTPRNTLHVPPASGAVPALARRRLCAKRRLAATSALHSRRSGLSSKPTPACCASALCCCAVLSCRKQHQNNSHAGRAQALSHPVKKPPAVLSQPKKRAACPRATHCLPAAAHSTRNLLPTSTSGGHSTLKGAAGSNGSLPACAPHVSSFRQHAHSSCTPTAHPLAHTGQAGSRLPHVMLVVSLSAQALLRPPLAPATQLHHLKESMPLLRLRMSALALLLLTPRPPSPVGALLARAGGRGGEPPTAGPKPPTAV